MIDNGILKLCDTGWRLYLLADGTRDDDPALAERLREWHEHKDNCAVCAGVKHD